MTDEKIRLFAEYFNFGMELASSLTLWHEGGGTYQLLAIVIREHDLTPCALYGIGQNNPMWVRPLREILHSGKWEWPNRWDRLMVDLADRLSQYEMETAV